MIFSAEEFIRLRESDLKEEQARASNDAAAESVWFDILRLYPKYKVWVVHNKKVPYVILDILTKDEDPEVRASVARKRKIDAELIARLSLDPDEGVRYALLCNATLTVSELLQVKVDDSDWLLRERNFIISSKK